MRLSLFVACLWFLACGGNGAPGIDRNCVRHPVLLLHGLGGQAKVWSVAGTVKHFENQGLAFGGEVHAAGEGPVRFVASEVAPATADFFTLHVSDPFQSLDLWQEELRDMVEEITDVSGAPKVVLVGFSAGGVAARRYLVEYPKDHRIAKLVTLASPHRGSELASIARRIVEISEGGRIEEPGVVNADRESEGVLRSLEERTGIDLDSDLVRELLPERDNEYLQWLNRSEHPLDVAYTPIVSLFQPGIETLEDLKREMSLLRSRSGRGDLIWALSGSISDLFSLLGGEGLSGSDGVVPVSSQDLSEVSFFKRNPDLIEDVHWLLGHHLGSKHGYETILRAIVGDVEFQKPRLSPSRRSAGWELSVELDTPLPGGAHVRAVDQAGRPLPVSGPTIERRDGIPVGVVRVGAFDAGQVARIELSVRPLGSPASFVQEIVVDDAVSRNGMAAPRERVQTVSLDVLSLHRLLAPKDEEGDWDAVGWPLVRRGDSGRGADPDVRIDLLVDDDVVTSSEVRPSTPDGARINASMTLAVKPQSQRVSLEVWDEDPGLSELMGTVTWKPGELPAGPAVVRTDTGMFLELAISRAGSEKRVLLPGSLRVQLPR